MFATRIHHPRPMFAARAFLFKQVLIKKEQKKARADCPPPLSSASKACLVPTAGFEDIAFNAFGQAATTLFMLMYILRALDITSVGEGTWERRHVGKKVRS